MHNRISCGEIRYVYDDIGQLIREDNSLLNATYVYTYDNAGNIISKSTYALTAAGTTPTNPTDIKAYGYAEKAWKDLLTTYAGVTFAYDGIGNPTKYFNGSIYSFGWEGRRLVAAQPQSNGCILRFAYDDNGLRIRKTTNGHATTYYYDGDMLIAQETDSYKWVFIYDESGSPIGYAFREHSFQYEWDVYWYTKNLQGDITAIYTNGGTKIVSYVYDAWGNFTSSYTTSDGGFHASTNPFTYRGYYYDHDLQMYYLQTRYYDPVVGRFINADNSAIITATPYALTDKNLFAYCDNNPVMRVDNGGAFWDTVFDVVSLGFSIVEVCVNPTDVWAWVGLAGDVVDLIPFVSGVGEVTRTVKTIDKVTDTVQIAKAVDFTDDAADIVKALDRSTGFTKSIASKGRKIHAGYKVGDGFNPKFKESRKISGVRPDYIDFDNKIIYELKPMNPQGIRSGIRQLQRYNKAFGGGFTLRLELY